MRGIFKSPSVLTQRYSSGILIVSVMVKNICSYLHAAVLKAGPLENGEETVSQTFQITAWRTRNIMWLGTCECWRHSPCQKAAVGTGLQQQGAGRKSWKCTKCVYSESIPRIWLQLPRIFPKLHIFCWLLLQGEELFYLQPGNHVPKELDKMYVDSLLGECMVAVTRMMLQALFILQLHKQLIKRC